MTLPMTAHMAVRDAFAAALLADPPVSPRVEEQRELSLPQGVASQVSVFRDASDPSEGFIRGAPVDWSTQLRVECKARTTAGATAERAADALCVAVYQRVMADPSLGGVALDLNPGPMRWEQDDLDTAVAVATQIFYARHRTQGRVLTQPTP